MSTSEDIMNKLFINPLDSIGRKLKGARRRHTSGTISQLGKSASVPLDFTPKSRHESFDFGEQIPVEVSELKVLSDFNN